MAIDMLLKVFGTLKVIAHSGKDHRGETRWLCDCSCGSDLCKKQITVLGSNLRRGNTKGCAAPKHNLSSTSEYKSWNGMWDRCTNPKNEAYSRYKDKTPPEEWEDFLVFLQDMGKKPTPLHSLDRVKNDLPYSKDNCRWATDKEQAQNRKSTVWYLFEGETFTQIDLARKLGLSPTGLSNRIAQGKYQGIISTINQQNLCPR